MYIYACCQCVQVSVGGQCGTVLLACYVLGQNKHLQHPYWHTMATDSRRHMSTLSTIRLSFQKLISVSLLYLSDYSNERDSHYNTLIIIVFTEFSH